MVRRFYVGAWVVRLGSCRDERARRRKRVGWVDWVHQWLVVGTGAGAIVLVGSYCVGDAGEIPAVSAERWRVKWLGCGPWRYLPTGGVGSGVLFGLPRYVVFRVGSPGLCACCVSIVRILL